MFYANCRPTTRREQTLMTKLKNTTPCQADRDYRADHPACDPDPLRAARVGSCGRSLYGGQEPFDEPCPNRRRNSSTSVINAATFPRTNQRVLRPELHRARPAPPRSNFAAYRIPSNPCKKPECVPWLGTLTIVRPLKGLRCRPVGHSD